jgi:hypothetical protein
VPKALPGLFEVGIEMKMPLLRRLTGDESIKATATWSKLDVFDDTIPGLCPFRKFHLAWIRVPEQNRRIVKRDVWDPSCPWNGCPFRKFDPACVFAP